MEGMTIGDIFEESLRLDVLLREPNPKVEPAIQECIHSLFMKRWDTYHRDIMTACSTTAPPAWISARRTSWS
jgi:hypothetical protein